MEETAQAKNLADLIGKLNKLAADKTVKNQDFFIKAMQYISEYQDLAEHIAVGQESLL